MDRKSLSSLVARSLRIGLFFCLFFCAFGCSSGGRLASTPLMTDLSPQFVPGSVSSMLVMPLSVAPGVDVRSDDLAALNADLLSSLQANTTYTVLNLRERESVEKTLSRLPADSDAARAMTAGRELRANAVLYGTVSSYGGEAIAQSTIDYNAQLRDPEERSDQSIARIRKSNPAGFQLWLLSPESGAVLWRASYQTTDQPLSENLLRFSAIRSGQTTGADPRESLTEGFVRASSALERLRR